MPYRAELERSGPVAASAARPSDCEPSIIGIGDPCNDVAARGVRLDRRWDRGHAARIAGNRPPPRWHGHLAREHVSLVRGPPAVPRPGAGAVRHSDEGLRPSRLGSRAGALLSAGAKRYDWVRARWAGAEGQRLH